MEQPKLKKLSKRAKIIIGVIGATGTVATTFAAVIPKLAAALEAAMNINRKTLMALAFILFIIVVVLPVIITLCIWILNQQKNRAEIERMKEYEKIRRASAKIPVPLEFGSNGFKLGSPGQPASRPQALDKHNIYDINEARKRKPDD